MNNQVQFRVFKPEEVAEIYQVSKNTIYKMIQDGKIFAKKINDRQYRIPYSEISWAFTGVDQDLDELEKIDLDILNNGGRELLKEIRNGRN